MEPNKKIASQPSWVIRNRQMELAVTQLGGHMAPVTFCRDTKTPVQPYYISPWQDEGLKIDDPVLRPLRGDFFCMPFGANAQAYKGMQFPCHGEPATGKWQFVGKRKTAGVTALSLEMNTKIAKGKVTKNIFLVDGQNVVYSQNVVEGIGGKMPLGHHATLALPEKDGDMRIATSAFKFGMVAPGVVGDPADGAYQSFDAGKKFRDLAKVPVIWKGQVADCTSFSAREGFTDLMAIFKKPGDSPAWTTATFQSKRFMWFSLKDAAVLPATAFWISNKGRHTSPWNGRNRCIGLEDGCGMFANGIADSVKKNVLNDAGIATAVKLSAKKPTAINYIQGVVKVPAGFDVVADAEFDADGVTFVSQSGKKARAEVNAAFLAAGAL